MLFHRSKNLLILFGALLVLAACTSRDAYIYDPDEFNREAPNFGKAVTDRSSVQVCYNKRTITRQDLLALVNGECARFGKHAVFRNQDLLECPILTPARATFDCVKTG